MKNKQEIASDHDLIIRLDSKMDDLKQDIKDLKDGTTTQINDHESRLRTLEKESEDHVLVKKVVYGAVSFVLLAVLSSVVYLVVQR